RPGTWVTGQLLRKESLVAGVDGELCPGRAAGVRSGGGGGRGVEGGVVPPPRGEPQERLQMARPLPGRRSGGAGRPLARAAPSSARGECGAGRALSGGEAGASDLGPSEGAGGPGGGRPADALAGGGHAR